MQDRYLEWKIEETRVEKYFLNLLEMGLLEWREFKNVYHTSH